MLLLLLASLNVASLLLARGAERRQELTTRMALGASRGRITRQFVVESLLIALAGGLLGLVASPAVSRVLLLFLPEGTNLSRWWTIGSFCSPSGQHRRRCAVRPCAGAAGRTAPASRLDQWAIDGHRRRSSFSQGDCGGTARTHPGSAGRRRPVRADADATVCQRTEDSRAAV